MVTSIDKFVFLICLQLSCESQYCWMGPDFIQPIIKGPQLRHKVMTLNFTTDPSGKKIRIFRRARLTSGARRSWATPPVTRHPPPPSPFARARSGTRRPSRRRTEFCYSFSQFGELVAESVNLTEFWCHAAMRIRQRSKTVLRIRGKKTAPVIFLESICPGRNFLGAMRVKTSLPLQIP